jgi:L-ascorbate metabolism protein UlaG (beta-lactamase superfamily)
VDITWLGYAALRARTRAASVVMEPAARSAGVDMGRPNADIVTVSHDHPSHAHVAGVRGEPVVLTRPGEYEIQGMQLLRLQHEDDVAAAARLTRQLEPRVVIPVCYERDASGDSAELAAYLGALGLEAEAPVARLSLQRRGLTDTTRVLLLESRG